MASKYVELYTNVTRQAERRTTLPSLYGVRRNVYSRLARIAYAAKAIALMAAVLNFFWFS